MTMHTAIRVPTIAIKVLEQSVMVFSKLRTPLEAGMPLHTKPKAPVHPTVAEAEQFWRSEQANLE